MKQVDNNIRYHSGAGCFFFKLQILLNDQCLQMAKFSMTLLGEFHTILYDETPLKQEEYLKGTPKSILLRLATFMIGLDPNVSGLYDWKNFLNMWFRDENLEFKRKVWNRCLELEHKQNANVSLLSPIASLRFFEFAFSYEELKPLQNPIESEINLFKSYLLLVTNETNKETTSDNYLQQLKGPFRVAATLFNQTYPLADFTNYNLGDLLITQIVKSYHLFEFLNVNNECRELMNGFYKTFGLNDWREYFQFILPIFEAHVKHPKKEGWTELNVERNEKFDRNCFFLEALSLKHFDTELDADFKLLRGNPIYRVDEGRYAIISPLFVLEKVFKGLYFKLKEIYDTLKLEEQPSKNFRSYYTSNFSENYLLYEILEYIYGSSSYKQFSGRELERKGIIGGPDYYIRNGNKLFLFENKDIFINADVKQSFDFHKVEVEIRKKLYKEDKNGRTVPKAILQLKNNIEAVLRKKNSFDTNYKERNLNIYPILVLHDSSFNAPGLNFILNEWFFHEIEELAKNGLDVVHVKPITIINIDTIILYADFLKEKRITMDVLIDRYVRFGKVDSKKQFRDFEHLKETIGQSLLSFSFFIDEFTNIGYNSASMRYRDKIMNGIFPKQIQ